MENQNLQPQNMEQLKKLAKVFNADNIITSDEIKQVLEGIVAILASYKRSTEQINEDTKAVVNHLLDKVEESKSAVYVEVSAKKDSTIAELDTKKESVIADFNTKIAEVKALLDTVRAIKIEKPQAPKEINKNDIVLAVMKEIKLPEHKVFELTGESVIASINALDTTDDDLKIDWKHIKNIPKNFGVTATQWVGSPIRYFSQMEDFDNTTAPTNGQVPVWNSTTSKWTPGSAGSGSPGGSDTQVQFNDGGAFGGNANLLFDKTTGTFTAGATVNLTKTSTGVLLVGTTTSAFRTTNGGTGQNLQTVFDVDNSIVVAGSQAFGFDTTNGFSFLAANTVRRIMRGAIKLTNVSGSNGAEIADLTFYVKPSNAAATETFRLQTRGNSIFTQGVHTTGSPTMATWTAAAHTTLTTTVEATDINFNLARTVQFATGAITTQRAMRIQAPTYSFVGASTITSAQTLNIGLPVAGTNATITNSYGLVVGTPNDFINTIANFGTSQNSFIDINVQNTSSGTLASTDVTACSDNASNGTNFIDMGITSSGFTDTNYTLWGGANRGYLFVEGAQLTIATARASAPIVFGVGGTLTANEVARFNGSGALGIGTGSTVSAQLHVIKTTEQERLGYDASNYQKTIVASNGSISFDLIGTSPTYTWKIGGTTELALNTSALTLPSSASPALTADGAIGYDTTQKTTSIGGGGITGNVVRFLKGGRPNETVTNTAAADFDFTSLFTIPANYIFTAKRLRLTLSFQFVTGVSTVTIQPYLKLGTTKVQVVGTAVNLTNSLTTNTVMQYFITGLAAAGAAANVETAVAVGLANGIMGTTSQPVALATNGTLNIVPGFTYSASGSTESATLLSWYLEELN